MSGYLAVSVKLSHSHVAALVLTDGGYRLLAQKTIISQSKQIPSDMILHPGERRPDRTSQKASPSDSISISYLLAAGGSYIYADRIYQASPGA